MIMKTFGRIAEVYYRNYQIGILQNAISAIKKANALLSFAKDKMIFQYNKVLMYLNITMTEISILIRRGTLVFQSRANLNYIIKVLPLLEMFNYRD